MRHTSRTETKVGRVIEKKPLDMIKKYAQEQGMRTLRDDAFLKVKQEVTTLDEAIRITTEE